MPFRAARRSIGASLLDANLTRFRLWAPDARCVSVQWEHDPDHEDAGPAGQPLGQPDHCVALQAQADGWFSGEVACPAGTRYRYCIDEQLSVPDPASRAQHGGLEGPSLVVDPAYAWRSSHWRGRPWVESIIYELHVGALGGFAGVEDHLHRLAELGITAIELMPINQFPGTRNWGYDGSLLFAPQSSYGSPTELKHLIDTAHGLGLQVFLDVVYNHFGPDGNYLGQYAKAFFRDDLHTPWGQAIDFRNRQVRGFFIENALMWILDYHFDGLRLDAVHHIVEHYFLLELAAQVQVHIAPERHVHLMLENEDNTSSLLCNAYTAQLSKGFTAQWNDDGHNVLHVLLTGEQEAYYRDFAQEPTQKLARCLAEGFVYQGQPDRHGNSRGEPSAQLPPSAFVLFLQNHDQVGNRALGERLLSLGDPQALRAAIALLLLSPMIPLLFMGEEWGSQQPFLFFTDHKPELAEAVRDGRRNEFADFPQFNDPASLARIPDPNALETFIRSIPDFGVLGPSEADPLKRRSQWQTDQRQAFENNQAPAPEQEKPPREWLALYRQLITLRRRHLIPRLLGSHSLGCQVLGHAAVKARWRLGDASTLTIAINLSPAAAALKGKPRGRLLFQSHPEAERVASKGQLAAYSALVYIEEHA
jgi:maltooligosyltrehalose trehalohydrolase